MYHAILGTLLYFFFELLMRCETRDIQFLGALPMLALLSGVDLIQHCRLLGGVQQHDHVQISIHGPYTLFAVLGNRPQFWKCITLTAGNVRRNAAPRSVE